MSVSVRAATEEDLASLAAMDVSYSTGRVLSIERSGTAPELSLTLRWHEAPRAERLYEDYTVEGLRRGLTYPDLFLAAEVAGRCAGLLMVLLPDYTDAGEITDLAVHRRLRRRGVGRELVQAAMAWAEDRRLRALWVEPRTENGQAIEFYLSLGFRFSGFNDRMHSNRDDQSGRPTLFMYKELA